MTTSVGGRPAHVYGAKPAAFKDYWVTLQRTPKPVIEEAFGLIAYEMNRGEHFFRVLFIPTDPSNSFYWVKLESSNGEKTFSFPALMAATDLERVMALWEIDGETTAWAPGPIASPAFPKGWKMPSNFALESRPFATLVRTHNGDLLLQFRAGVHTLTQDTMRCAGILGPAGDLGFMGKLQYDGPMPVNTPLNPGQVFALRQLSANYFHKVLLTPGKGRIHPHLPHADLLQIPQHSVTELFL